MGQKVSLKPAATSVNLADIMYIIQDGVSKKISIEVLQRYLALMGDAVISENEITVNVVNNIPTVTFTPNTINYRYLGIILSIIAGAIALPAIPPTDARFDAIFINCAQNTHVIEVLSGEVAENPAQPILTANQILISYVYVSQAYISVEPAGREKVVYIGKHGLDTNDGLSIATAVRNIPRAQEVMQTKGCRILQCMDDGSYELLTTPVMSGRIIYRFPNARLYKTTDTLDLVSNYTISAYLLNASVRLLSKSNIVLDCWKIDALQISNTSALLTGNTAITGTLSITGTSDVRCTPIKAGTFTTDQTAYISGIINGEVYPNLSFADINAAIDALEQNDITLAQAIDGKVANTDSRLTDSRTPTDNSVTIAKLATELKGVSTLSGTNVDWSSGIQFNLTLTANVTLTFSNTVIGKTISIRATGNYAITWPAGCKITGTYSGTLVNLIQIYCSATGEYFTTILAL